MKTDRELLELAAQYAKLAQHCAMLEAKLADVEKSEPVAPTYYMRDNHTFKRLSEDVPTALIEIEAEFNEGYTYGVLCSKRKGFETISASGSKDRLKFFQACKERFESIYPTHPAPQPKAEPCGYDETTGNCTSNPCCNPAPQPKAEPVNQTMQGCACRWDADDNRVATCVRHQGWLDVVQEWADRAKAAEQAPQPTELTDLELELPEGDTLSHTHPEGWRAVRKYARAVLAAQKEKV